MSTLNNINNYYERLVLEEVTEQLANDSNDEDFITDVVCIALNALPCRYFRHGVDMAFYLSSDDYLHMRNHAREAVANALQHIRHSNRP